MLGRLLPLLLLGGCVTAPCVPPAYEPGNAAGEPRVELPPSATWSLSRGNCSGYGYYPMIYGSFAGFRVQDGSPARRPRHGGWNAGGRR